MTPILQQHTASCFTMLADHSYPATAITAPFTEASVIELLPSAIRELDSANPRGAALNSVFRFLFGPVTGYLIKKWGQHELDLEQIALESVRIVITQLPEFNPQQGSLIGLACTIASRQASRSYKSVIAKSLSSKKPTSKLNLSATPTTDERLDLVDALLGLSDDDRALLHAIEVEGLDATEAAERFGITPASARKRKERALKRINPTFPQTH